MMRIKTVLASLAATGLLLAQPAAAATAHRSGSSTRDSQQLAGVPSAAMPAIIALIAVAIVAIIAASSRHHEPVSP